MGERRGGSRGVAWERGEQHILRDLARKRDLEEALDRFHERARVDVFVWMDRDAAGKALGAAQELRAVEHELCLLYLRQIRREQAERFTLAKQGGSSQGVDARHYAIDPIRAHQVRILEAQEMVDHEVGNLRALLGEEATRYADRDRRARLRWLLVLLREIQPEAADHIEETWSQHWANAVAARLGARHQGLILHARKPTMDRDRGGRPVSAHPECA